MNGLRGRVAVVTGGSRGIGAAIAKRLAKDGAIVVLTYVRQHEAARQVVREIESLGGEADTMQADAASPEQMRSVLTETRANYGRLDILVNNAAISEYRPLEQIDMDHYTRLFDINVRGPVFAMQEAAGMMGEGGRILNITSGAAQAAPPGASLYSAAKAALETITRSIAAELGPRGITVNALAPGITETDMLNEVLPPEVQQAMVQNTALRRLGMPADIADAAAFLVSDEARWITGQVIHVNGGLR